MKNKVFLFVGFILLVVGIIVYYAIGADSAGIIVQGKQVNDSGLKNILKYSIGGGIAGLGGIFLLAGLIGQIRYSKLNKQKLHILRTGVETEGTVTFVDKNYSLLVNNNPVYSIVEYTYPDNSGNEYTRRVETISSEIVIRNRIQVGNIIPIKYAVEDPSLSVILLQSPAKMPSPIVNCKYCGSKFSVNKYESCPKCGAG